jgi:Leucine-rich repeat (LRR) protein
VACVWTYSGAGDVARARRLAAQAVTAESRAQHPPRRCCCGGAAAAAAAAAMGNGSSAPEETERERERRSGDMTKAEVWRIKTFFRLLMVYKIEWVHEVSGRVHHNSKMQRLQWSLSKLDLRENRLKYFPPQIKRLKQLRELNLSQNAFKRFPADAFRAPKLETIKISDNRIRNIRLESLMPSMLSNLVELHLDNNRIAELPDAFIDFCNLEVLNLSANGFLDFPDLICEMTTLRQLMMEQNSMWFLPQTFAQLEGLEVLALNANNFEMMPRVLCDMDRLVDLRLGRNGITSLMRGETIQTHLDNGQVITMVVETFKLMTDLKKLTVAMNELTDLPPDVWDVKLDHLNLRNNEIAGELPVEIVKLKDTLVELYLDENQLTALPSCLTDFPHLEYLTVNGNKLKSLPKMPQQLLELHAASNDLGKLPKSLYQPHHREKGYKKLKVLDVRGNKRLDYPPPSYLLRADEIGEYLEKLKEGADNIMLDPVRPSACPPARLHACMFVELFADANRWLCVLR